MKKHLTILLSSITIVLLWNYQEFKVGGGLGFIRNNLGWLLILLTVAFVSVQTLNLKALKIYSHWKLSLIGLFIAVVPFVLSSKTSWEVSWLLPFGLIGSCFLLVALIQFKYLLKHPVAVLWCLIILTGVEVLLGYGYLLHRLAMDYTSGTAFKLPNLSISFNQRNLYASFISSGLLASLYLLFNTPTHKQKKILAVLLVTGTFILFITESRVGIYSFIVGALLLSIVQIKNQSRQVLGYLAGITLTIITSYSFSSLIYEEGASKDFSNTTHRQFIYTTSIKAIADKPFIGHGLGSFTKAYTVKAGERVLKENIPLETILNRPENLSHPHNELLYWGVQGGLTSILGLILLALSIYLNIAKLRLFTQLSYIALLTPIFLHLMVELPFYISTVHLILFVGLIAFTLIDTKSISSKSFSSTPSKSALLFISSICFLVSMAIINNTYQLTKTVRFQTALNKNIQELESIQFPLGWHNELEEVKLRYYANVGAKRGDKEPIIEFTHWLESYNQKYPILQNYFNLYYSYKLLQEEQKANNIVQQVKTQYLGVKEADKWLKSIDSDVK